MTEADATEVEITLFGETRTVEATAFSRPVEEANRLFVYGLVATIGAGKARYPEPLILDRLRGDEKAYRGNNTVTDAEGRRYQFHLGTCVRNRQARFVGWADTAGVTNYSDQTRALGPARAAPASSGDRGIPHPETSHTWLSKERRPL